MCFFLCYVLVVTEITTMDCNHFTCCIIDLRRSSRWMAIITTSAQLQLTRIPRGWLRFTLPDQQLVGECSAMGPRTAGLPLRLEEETEEEARSPTCEP